MDSSAWILHVEDDEIDAESLRRAFSRCSIANPLRTARSAEQALSWVREGRGEAAAPGLILLDLNMPGVGGLAFLRELKADPELRCIPVVVLTGSNHEADRRLAYESGAAGYVVKPIDPEEFVRAVQVVERYWALCEPA